MENSIIVIPTYWCREKPRKGDQIYDHPTPLNSEGTLGRLLESLKILENREIEVLIISVPTFQDTEQLVKNKVDEILAPFDDYHEIYHFSYQTLLKFHDVFEKQGKPEYKDFLSLFGYSNVRNCCIFLPNILDKEIAILIDDDEVFEDPKFLQKATEFVSPDKPGIAGYYVQAQGGYKLDAKVPWHRLFWNNAESMNKAFEIIDSGERLKDTPFVFGGNMILHKDLFMKIPFDPYIRRGEDISYLCDAKQEGFPFLLDRELSIRHLPPKGTMPEFIKMREDIYRFVYMRQKLLKQGFDLKRTMPYPGEFLRVDLPLKIVITSLLHALDSFLDYKIIPGFEYIANILYMLDAYLKAPTWYKKFNSLKESWPDFMNWSYKNRNLFMQALKTR
ncbi:MAG: hypothetical protein ACTSRW_10485 [Candidatus Helarchaeota archaeon]